MLDEYGFEVYEENAFPIAYLLTFRTFGTGNHGDRRGSIQRSREMVNELKAYATRRLRAEGSFDQGIKIWSRGASTRYLWKPRHVEAAIDYVMHSQGDVPFETVYRID